MILSAMTAWDNGRLEFSNALDSRTEGTYTYPAADTIVLSQVRTFFPGPNGVAHDPGTTTTVFHLDAWDRPTYILMTNHLHLESVERLEIEFRS
jgi:hypothetical protein